MGECGTMMPRGSTQNSGIGHRGVKPVAEEQKMCCILLGVGRYSSCERGRCLLFMVRGLIFDG